MIAAALTLLLGIVVILAIIAAHGYFGAQEFAHMSVDRARLGARAEAGGQLTAVRHDGRFVGVMTVSDVLRRVLPLELTPAAQPGWARASTRGDAVPGAVPTTVPGTASSPRSGRINRMTTLVVDKTLVPPVPATDSGRNRPDNQGR